MSVCGCRSFGLAVCETAQIVKGLKIFNESVQ